MIKSLSLPFAAQHGRQNGETAMDSSAGIVSYSFLGIRVDVANPAHATLSIWEAALARSGLRVVLADLWTFLFAQRDYSVWESLSSADFVLPAGNPSILRRLMRSPNLPILQPELLLVDLCAAATRNNKVVALLAPEGELSADVALARQVWPTLEAVGLSKNTLNTADPTDPELVRAVNALRPDILMVGGDSPWQERWLHEQRGRLDVGVAVVFPTLHAASAGGPPRAGVPVAGLGRLRRQAALQRAMSTTIGPMATASAATLGSWLQEARGGLSEWSEALQARRAPAALKRLGPLALPAGNPGSHVTVRVAELRDSDEIEASRRLGAPPLARLAQPAQPPALPPAEQRETFADQPTVALSLDGLRGAPPQVVTGYIVQTIDHTAAAEGAAPAAGAGSGDEDAANAAPSPPGQLAPTTRLAARFAAAAARPPDAAASSPSEPGPTQRLPNRVPYVPIPDDLPVTTVLRGPDDPDLPATTTLRGPDSADLPATTLLREPESAPPAPTAGAGATAEENETAALSAAPTTIPFLEAASVPAVDVPPQGQATPRRARRGYKARRPRRQLARRRRKAKAQRSHHLR
jgi:UDP-N-acetyl-D-mannosaminuronic acid transferase (WecB/TagA/CpsF family)